MLLRAMASPSFRRRTSLQSLFIAAGSDFDLCGQLAIDVETAQRIIAQSPAIQQLARKGVLTWYERQ